MREMNRLNQEGTTIMLVTHDMKVASKCSRILYIVDGNIKGELSLGVLGDEREGKARERKVANWLDDMGW